MLRSLVLVGSLVALVASAPVAAAVPLFTLVTKSGHSESLSYVGYTFGTLSPPLGKAGTIEVDCKAPDEAALRKELAVGTKLASASLRISAELPRPQHFAYRFADAKVTALSFATGHFGPVAAITLAYTKLSKTP